jgi:hypothetical protein
MADTVTVGQELEGRILDAVHKSNTVAFEAMKVLTDAIQPVISVIPSVTPPLAYDFAEQLMASQRKFAEDMLHLTARLTPTTAK